MKTFKNLIEVVEYFKDDAVCRKHLASLRWSGGMACPHCGSVNFYTFKDGKTYKCKEKECNLKFNVKTGTIFENTKIPLQKWFAALYLITSHKKGISSIQVGKDLSITQKSAWFMMHRLRMMFESKQMGLLKGIVEADDTWIGGEAVKANQSKYRQERKRIKNLQERKVVRKEKFCVAGVVERGGRLILKHIPKREKYKNLLGEFVIEHVKAKSTVYTDEFPGFRNLKYSGFKHDYVTHGKHEYVRGEVTTNTIEGAFSLLKRGYIGIYHYMSKKHLQRYCNEFAFRYSTRVMNENERFNESLKMCDGRLKYFELTAKELQPDF